MEEISRLFDTVLNIDFIRAVISNPREKDGIIKRRNNKSKSPPAQEKGQTGFSV